MEKVVRFKDPSTAMIQFPFYDPNDLPYVIGDNLKIYDTKNRDSAGILHCMECSGADLRTLGFLR